MSEQQFHGFVAALEQAFDKVVEVGSDQQLFVSSYLSGHFSLIVANALNQQQYCLQALDESMQASLAAAFAKGELQQQDQAEVMDLWQTLFRQFA